MGGLNKALDTILIERRNALKDRENRISPGSVIPRSAAPPAPGAGYGHAALGNATSIYATPTGNVHVDKARAFVADIDTMQANIERARVYGAPYIGDYETGDVHWTKLKNDLTDNGVAKNPGVRLFFPWRPSVVMDSGYTENQPPDYNRFRRFLHAATRALKLGFYVFLDTMDVLTDNDTNSSTSLINEVAAAQALIIQDVRLGNNPQGYVWPTHRFAVGSGNEWGGETNAFWNAMRINHLTVFRAALGTDVILSTGPSVWKSPDQLNSTMQMPSINDGPIIVEVHLYGTDSQSASASFWASQQTKCLNWSNGVGLGVPVVFNEYSWTDAFGSSGSNYSLIPNAIAAAAQGMPQIKPSLWVITSGGWRCNKTTTNGDLMDGTSGQPNVVSSFRTNSAVMRNAADRPARSAI